MAGRAGRRGSFRPLPGRRARRAAARAGLAARGSQWPRGDGAIEARAATEATEARRAHRTDRPGAGCWHSRCAPAPRSPCGLGAPPGQPHPPPAVAAPRAARLGSGRTRSAAPGSGGSVVPSGRVLRDKRGSRSRGGAPGAPGGGWRAEGARSPRGARLRARRGSEPTPETGPVRWPRRTHEPPESPLRASRRCPSPGPPAPQRVLAAGGLPGTEPAAAGVGRRVRGARRLDLTHHALLRLQRRRRPGGSAAAVASESGATARRLHWCRSGACARGAKETHALALPHTRERRERRGGSRSAHRRLRLLARAPGGRGVPLCFSPIAALEAPRHQSSGHPLINEANQARRAKRGPGVGRECTLCSWPVEDQTFPAFARSSPGGRSHPIGSLAVRNRSWSWGFCKPLPLSSGGAGCREIRSNPLLQVPKLRPGVKWLV